MTTTPPRHDIAPDLVANQADAAVPSSAGQTEAPETAQELVRWQDLLGQVGREMAEPLTAALERVITLTTTGRIDHQGLRALREDIERARHAGMACQQMSRLASGRIRQSHELVHLTHTVQSVLAHRTRDLQARGLTISQSMLPLEVHADASMLFALLNHLVDWCLACARGTVELKLDLRPWPAHARLSCQFPAHQPDVPPPAEDVTLTRASTLSWHLLEQTARTMGLPCSRQVRDHQLVLALEFPQTVTSLLGAPAEDESGHSAFEDSINSRPLAGSHVLLIADRKDVRQQVREALHGMGLMLDTCESAQEAVDFCRQGLPHAIVFASSMRSPLLDRLFSHIRVDMPAFVFIELMAEGRTFEISSLQASGMARVGGEDLAHALPSALVYELSRLH